MLINILTFIALSLLITVLSFDLKRHLELRKSKKRLEKSFKEFMDAIDEHEEDCDCEDVKSGIRAEAPEVSEIPKKEKIVMIKSAQTGNHFSKKLSADQIKEIGKAPFSITHRALAVKYGVSEGRIGQIRRGAKQAKKAK